MRHGIGDEEDLDRVELLADCCSSIIKSSSASPGSPAVSINQASPVICVLSRRAERTRSAGCRFAGRAFIDGQADVAPE